MTLIETTTLQLSLKWSNDVYKLYCIYLVQNKPQLMLVTIEAIVLRKVHGTDGDFYLRYACDDNATILIGGLT